MSEVRDLFRTLFPITRSVAGEGNRLTLRILSRVSPLRLLEIPSGKRCFDWVVPREWNLREAFIEDSRGRRILDARKNNLHCVNYSEPVDRIVPRDELLTHLHTLPALPRAIPYVTSYYQPRWGFCVQHSRLRRFRGRRFRVRILAEKKKGSMTLGEAVVRGRSPEEILFSTYICHPSMANNELSGPVLQILLLRYVRSLRKPHYTYRFLFCPETIGSTAYLHLRGRRLKQRVRAGYVITCVGMSGKFTYKKSRPGNSLADRVALSVLSDEGEKFEVRPWVPSGSDERQYGSPGFRLPVGSLMTRMYGQYPQYHTSLDNLNLINFPKFQACLEVYQKIIARLEANRTYLGTVQHGEPNLGRRNLYPTLGGQKKNTDQLRAIRALCAFADGRTDLLGVAEVSGISFARLADAAEKLRAAGLLHTVR